MSLQVKGPVAVVGCGTIGASWACLFLAHGLDVVATDIREDAESTLLSAIEGFWPSLPKDVLDLRLCGSLRFTPDLAAACTGAGFVQENAVERVDETLTLDGLRLLFELNREG